MKFYILATGSSLFTYLSHCIGDLLDKLKWHVHYFEAYSYVWLLYIGFVSEWFQIDLDKVIVKKLQSS